MKLSNELFKSDTNATLFHLFIEMKMTKLYQYLLGTLGERVPMSPPCMCGLYQSAGLIHLSLNSQRVISKRGFSYRAGLNTACTVYK